MKTAIGTKQDHSTKKQIVQSNLFTATDEWLIQCWNKKDLYNIPGGPLYEFPEFAQVANPDNIEVFPSDGVWEWDTTEGEDRNDYGYYSSDGMSIETPKMSKVTNAKLGIITHFKPWHFGQDEEKWVEKFSTWDVEEGEQFPYIILGKIPALEVLEYCNKNKTKRYVLPL